jgi:hypothetical protein
MSRCLSDAALARVMAELGTPDERAHLATCVTCTGRYRGLTHDMDVIRHVLATTPEPAARAVPQARRWVPIVAALSAVAVAALLWIEVSVWRAVQPAPPAPEPVTLALADVSAALFSVSGEPARVQSPLQELEQDDETNIACDGPEWLADSRCRGALGGLADPALMEGDGPDDGNDAEQGGEQ